MDCLAKKGSFTRKATPFCCLQWLGLSWRQTSVLSAGVCPHGSQPLATGAGGWVLKLLLLLLTHHFTTQINDEFVLDPRAVAVAKISSSSSSAVCTSLLAPQWVAEPPLHCPEKSTEVDFFLRHPSSLLGHPSRDLGCRGVWKSTGSRFYSRFSTTH